MGWSKPKKRAQIDVSKPLCRGGKVQLGSSGKTVWTVFKYERLPDFCYGCGRIGHGLIECFDKRVRKMKSSDPLLYSPEMRVVSKSSSAGLVVGDRRGAKALRGVSECFRNPNFSAPEPMGGLSGDRKSVQRDLRNLGADSMPSSNHQGSRSDFEGCLDLENVINADINSSKLTMLSIVSNDKLSEGQSSPTDNPLREGVNLHGPARTKDGGEEAFVFSIGSVVPVKQNVGNWKKDARRKGKIAVDCVGRSGGLSLLWTDSWQVRFRSSSRAHIDVDVIFDLGVAWQFTGFYGPAKKKYCRWAWDLLKRLPTNSNVPWICGGDFNEALESCDLVDLGFVGPKLMWDNRREGRANIQVRLERFVANTSWRSKYRRARVEVMDFWGFDHRALLLRLSPKSNKDMKRWGVGFQFEPLWVKDEECTKFIRESWQNVSFDGSPNNMVSVMNLQRSLETLHNGPRTKAALSDIHEAKKEFDKVLGWEEEYWRQRLRRRIGDGRSTRVFAYPWLPKPTSFHIITHPKEGNQHLMVIDLITNGPRSWDLERINQVLWLVDHDPIKCIPLGDNNVGDKWIWHYDSNGRYNVHSGYRIVMDSRRHTCSSNPNPDIHWRRLWSLQVPPKVRLVIWHAFHSIIPTMNSLNRREIKRFGGSLGYGIQLLRKWKFPLRIVSELWRWNSLLMILLYFVGLLGNVGVKETRLYMEWRLVILKSVLEFGIASFGEWRALHYMAPKQTQQSVGSELWQFPLTGFFKLNVDAAVISGSNHFGVGAVIRNDSGLVCGALAKSIDGKFSPFLAKCFALREGLKLAKELEISGLVMETDATNVASAIRGDLELSIEGPILDDI
ncbi:hypothetical protein TIFTF001_017816 [Ficus carica]|uniref:CCHC-type domain-containing protein n=1 Tax=Ficus carica TaxID=3494 RepID=A0AA88A335_FICCA|nr:hypothetical protein TIFTF001_017816 [Ficus carica]